MEKIKSLREQVLELSANGITAVEVAKALKITRRRVYSIRVADSKRRLRTGESRTRVVLPAGISSADEGSLKAVVLYGKTSEVLEAVKRL